MSSSGKNSNEKYLQKIRLEILNKSEELNYIKKKLSINEKDLNAMELLLLKNDIANKINNIIKYRNDEKENKEELITKENQTIENSIPIESIKSEFNSEYEKLINSVKTIKDTINLVKMLGSNNKLKTMFEIKNKNINKIYEMINITRIETNKMDKIIENLNKYIKKEFKYDFINDVYKEIKISESTDIFSDVELFFNSYKQYYDDLIKSINLLLDQINNKELVLITDSDSIGNYNRIIEKKMNKYNSIISDGKNDKNTVKGKIKYVLPYTDVLYASVIQLIVIIDYLSYFYRSK